MRTVLFVLVALLCGYLVWLIFRLRRVSRAARSRRDAELFRDIDRFSPDLSSTLDPKYSTRAAEEVDTDDAIVTLSSQVDPDETPDDRKVVEDARAPRPMEPDASGFGFDALLEVRQMRHIVDEQRTQLQTMGEELANLREEVASLRAASRVSPAYSEAVALVRRGFDAQSIAERCGISVAEAELVISLSAQADNNNPEREDFHG